MNVMIQDETLERKPFAKVKIADRQDTDAEIIKDEFMSNETEVKNKIKIDNLNAYYGDFQSLKNINLKIKPYTVMAFIGPSGCGKSTLIRIFNRMNDYIDGFRIEGSVKLDNKDVYDKNINIEQLRKQVGMVFQKPNPFPKSIFDNVAYGLKIQGIKDHNFIQERVESSLKRVVLWDEVKDNLKKNAYALSGGQQQRLCIARTLAVEPSVILMDEPTSALDPISTAKIEDLIFELKNKYTIVIVTHNMQQASRISDNTAFFYLGEIIETGKTKQIFTNPQIEQTERYISGHFG
jgi:phosphate transport system ATP-binding protein